MKIIVYGSKKQAEFFISNVTNVDILAVVDSYSSQTDKMFCGYRVKGKEEVDFEKADYVIVCSNAYKEIIDGLREYCSVDKIIVTNYDNISYESVKEFERNPLYNNLSEASREFYRKKIEEKIEERCINNIISKYSYTHSAEYPESLYEVHFSHEERMIAKMIDFITRQTSIDLVQNNCFGYKNYLDVGLESEFVSKFNFAGDCYPILKYIENYNNNISCAFDVGANRGLVSLFLSQIADKVYSFEPSREMSDIGQKNIQLNSAENIIWNNLGVSNESGELVLNEFGIEAGGHNSFIPQYNDALISQRKVKVVTIDEYCCENNITNIDLMKIDVEGFEPYVIAGAKNMISKKAIRCIIFEISPLLNKEKNDYYEMLECLYQMGYRFTDLHNNDISIKKITELTSHRDIVATI